MKTTIEKPISNDKFINLLASNEHYFEKVGYCGGMTYSAIYCEKSGELIAYREIEGSSILCFEIINEEQ